MARSGGAGEHQRLESCNSEAPFQSVIIAISHKVALQRCCRKGWGEKEKSVRVSVGSNDYNCLHKSQTLEGVQAKI